MAISTVASNDTVVCVVQAINNFLTFFFYSAGGLSTAEAVGIAIALSSIVSFTAGLLVALVIAYCYFRQQKNQSSPRDTQQPPALYEDISMVTKDIELKENIAYGPVGH